MFLVSSLVKVWDLHICSTSFKVMGKLFKLTYEPALKLSVVVIWLKCDPGSKLTDFKTNLEGMHPLSFHKPAVKEMVTNLL